MISGCDDHQTAADVSNVGSFQLPDPNGKAAGACTSTLLKVLYEDEMEEYTFVQVLEKMRSLLKQNRFTQIPQLSSAKPIDMNTKFRIVPDDLTGTRRAVLIGINYTGQKGALKGCHNDVFNLYTYIQDQYGFQDEDITVLADDGDHPAPTKQNILSTYHDIIRKSRPGDSIFLHYSGHGTKVKDLNGDEDDGYDEALVPVDSNRGGGVIIDDDLYDILVKGLPAGVHVVALMDCCHSGTVLDLPYIFKADGNFKQMEVDKSSKILGQVFGLGKLIQSKMGKTILNQGVKLVKGGEKTGKLMTGYVKKLVKQR